MYIVVMSVTAAENAKYRDFVSRIAQENGCFDFQPEQIVWHYTDGNGLLGILQSSTIYATQVAALNDAKETKHAAELFAAAMKEMLSKEGARPEVKEFVETVVKFTNENLDSRVTSKFFVACFSGEEDDVTQWDRYGKDGGYAIGFVARGLQREPSSTLFKVVYDPDKHKSAAEQLAQATIDLYLEGLTGERLNDPEQWTKDFLTACDDWVYKLAPLAKAWKWRAENEYRLVHELKLAEFPSVRFIAKSTMIARYLPLATPSWVPRRSALLPISKIIVGPCNNFAVSRVSIALLLDQMGYPPVEIRESDCSLTRP